MASRHAFVGPAYLRGIVDHGEMSGVARALSKLRACR